MIIVEFRYDRWEVIRRYGLRESLIGFRATEREALELAARWGKKSAVSEAVAAEREACAKIAEDRLADGEFYDIPKEIRARGANSGPDADRGKS